jgi:hypothetical protein
VRVTISTKSDQSLPKVSPELKFNDNDIKKLSFADQVDWHLQHSSNKLPVPKDAREESYLRLILQREYSEKRLKLTKDLSQINIYTTISLVLFSVIFAVSCLLYGLIHLGAGSTHFREMISIESASSPSTGKESLFHTDTKRVA